VNTPRIDDPVSSQSDGVSRRTVVGAGATGLALALLARSFSQAAAQEATPAAEGGMPPGVAATPLINAPIPAADVPSGGFTMSIARVTFEPGSSTPVSAADRARVAYVESGTLICPGEAPRFVIAADGTVTEYGAEDITINTGEAIYIPPNVPDGARNDGTELLSVLLVDLVPTEEMATPSA
jgi:quercetin dioxygenase-like cupin family protein